MCGKFNCTDQNLYEKKLTAQIPQVAKFYKSGYKTFEIDIKTDKKVSFGLDSYISDSPKIFCLRDYLS